MLASAASVSHSSVTLAGMASISHSGHGWSGAPMRQPSRTRRMNSRSTSATSSAPPSSCNATLARLISSQMAHKSWRQELAARAGGAQFVCSPAARLVVSPACYSPGRLGGSSLTSPPSHRRRPGHPSPLPTRSLWITWRWRLLGRWRLGGGA